MAKEISTLKGSIILLFAAFIAGGAMIWQYLDYLNSF